eukprot:1927256-Prymnesium_polylepis.4
MDPRCAPAVQSAEKKKSRKKVRHRHSPCFDGQRWSRIWVSSSLVNRSAGDHTNRESDDRCAYDAVQRRVDRIKSAIGSHLFQCRLNVREQALAHLPQQSLPVDSGWLPDVHVVVRQLIQVAPKDVRVHLVGGDVRKDERVVFAMLGEECDEFLRKQVPRRQRRDVMLDVEAVVERLLVSGAVAQIVTVPVRALGMRA